jgi:hypothetical protein
MVSHAILLDLLGRLRDYVVYRNLRDGLADLDRSAEDIRVFLEKAPRQS